MSENADKLGLFGEHDLSFLSPPKRYYDKASGSLLTASQALNNCRYRLLPFGDNWLVSEVLVCDRPKFNGKGYGLLDPVRRSSPMGDDDTPLTPEERKAYINRSRRRAYKKVKDIMQANDFEYFMTFTLDGAKIDRTDYKAFIEKVRQYLDNRVRRYNWRYCAVVEYHKRKEANGKHAIHLHACISGDKYNLIDSGTVIRPCGGKPVKRATARKQGYKDSELKTVYNVSDWSLGHSTAIHTYGKRLALARYITKYITKSDDKVGGRWYYSGGKLEFPLYVYDDIDFDSFAADIDFEHEYGNYKIKYYDDGVDIGSLDFNR